MDIVPTLSMPGDATTFSPGASAADQRLAERGGRAAGRRVRDLAGVDSGALAGALALAAIVALSLFVVLMASNRPSLLTPTTHAGYFPRWMAGPLGGLLPGFTDNGKTLKYLFSGAVVAMYVGYLVALRCAPRLRARWVIAAILAAHAIFLLAPPLALTDVFNYINYGRMEVVHHLNPYTSIPILESHDDPSYILSNWHQLLSPYGPLFTLLTFAVVPIGVAASFWALKGVLVVASLATIYLVWRCARLLGRDPLAAIALVGLNPIVLVWGLGGDHNDFLMVFFIVLGFYLMFLARSREQDDDGADPMADGRADAAAAPATEVVADARAAAATDAAPPPAGATVPIGWRSIARGWLLPPSALSIGSGAAFVVATAIKASGGVLIPVVLAGLLRAPRALVQTLLGMLAAAVAVGAVSLLAFGLHIPDLSTQGSLVTSESVPNLIGLVAGAGGESTGLREGLSVVLIVAVLGCCWLAWRWRDSVTASGWASVALLVTLSWVLPWYVLWVLPLAALSRSRALRMAALVVGVYLIVAWAPASGLLWNAIGFHPEKTALGRLHQRSVKELLN
jgi:hypothetical protein